MRKIAKRLAGILMALCVALTSAPAFAQEVAAAEADDRVDADILVQKVEGLSEDFIHGMDISSYLSVVQSGVRFKDAEGNEKNLLDILSDAGVNWIRLRVWNCPYVLDADGNVKYAEYLEDGSIKEHAGNEVTEKREDPTYHFTEYFLSDGTQVYPMGYGGGNCDLENAKAVGKMATERGMRVLIDFHYSDFWADPNKRSTPKAWEGMDLAQKEEALAAFTRDSLSELLDAGVDVGMVQVGNETNNGLAGEGEDNVPALIKAGCEAVRAVSKEKGKDILIAVHFTDPQSEGYQHRKAEALEEAGVDYDVFASTYYPFWHGTAESLSANLKDIAETFGKKVMIAEVSYPRTTEDGDASGNNAGNEGDGLEYRYQINEQGQAAAVRDAIAAVSAVGESGLGTFYWEPAWLPAGGKAYDGTEESLAQKKEMWKKYGCGWASVFAGPDYDNYDFEISGDVTGSGWDNQAFFDFEGKALDSLNVYRWVYTGTKGPVDVQEVGEASYEMGYGEAPSLPGTVTVSLTDGSSQEVPVTWNAEQVAALSSADYGEYEVEGTLGEFSYESKGEKVTVPAGTYVTKCTVSVAGENLVTNGSFETGDASGWTLTNNKGEGVGFPKVDVSESNAKSGKYYYTAYGEDIDFAIEQEIAGEESMAGEYALFAYYQGTNVDEVRGDSALYAVVTTADGQQQEYSAPIEIHNAWQDFSFSKVDVTIPEDVSSIKVGTRLSVAGAQGAWVVADDISLMRRDPAQAASYTVSFDANGGKVSTKSKTVVAGETYGKLPSPRRAGYAFDGWYTEKKGGSKVTAATVASIREDQTLYAHWTKVKKPAQVKKLSVKAKGGKKILASYQKASGAAGYEISCSPSAKFAKKDTVTVTTKKLQGTVSGLKKGKTYYVRVAAFAKDSTGAKVKGPYSKVAKIVLK